MAMAHATTPTVQHHPGLVDDVDLHESARIQVDYLSHKWQEADVWHTWRNMTRQKNDIANGARLENASWRTWWQKRLKLKTVNPQKLNWLKDSDVTWLYGPLHEAPVPVVPPRKNATFEEKLSSLPPLPKGRKPILKKRTLAEVLVLGLAKTNNLTNEPPPADELKELDIDSRAVRGPEERDRIMLLHTKSDTNLLRPALQQPSLGESTTRRRPARMGLDRSSFSMSTKASPSPPPHEHEVTTKKRVGFNTFVSQCIAITPKERNSSDDDSADDALSMKSGGSTSHGPHHELHVPSMSRSNSHSSARSEPLIIAPMAPTLLKEMVGDESCMSPLVYQPTKTPFDSDSDDDSDFGNPPAPPPKIVTLPVSTDLAAASTAQGDLGGDEYNTPSKKRKLSAGEIPPARRQFKESQETPATIEQASISTNTLTGGIKDSLLVVASGDEDTRGRTLHRTSSSSSLNERSRSRNGNSPLGGHSPESSRASSNSTRGSSAEVGLTVHSGRGVTMADPKPAAIPEEASTTTQDVDTPMTDSAPKTEPQAKSSPKLEPSGFVDKAVANAKGLIGSFLPSGSGVSKRGTL